VFAGRKIGEHHRLLGACEKVSVLRGAMLVN
jgi:hypothetical protein